MKDKKDYNIIVILGAGEKCHKCSKPMERRKHKSQNPRKTFFYTKWDFCVNCKHVQHYDEFKSAQWKESEQQDSFFRNI